MPSKPHPAPRTTRKSDGSIVLRNARHELFAQQLAQGKSAEEAYRLAGYATNRGNPTRLTGNESVTVRVRYLLETAAEKAGVTVQRIVDELAKIAFVDAGDFFVWDADGVRVRPSADLTSDQRAAVAEVQETRTRGRNGDQTIRVKLSDKLAALEKLGRHLGMFRDRLEHGGAIEMGPVTTYQGVRLDEADPETLGFLAAKRRRELAERSKTA